MSVNDTHDHMVEAEEEVGVPVVDVVYHLAVHQALQDQLANLDMMEHLDYLAHLEKMHHHNLHFQLEALGTCVYF